MIAALAPLYVGEFASYRDVLTTRDDARPSLPASQLLQTARLWRAQRMALAIGNTQALRIAFASRTTAPGCR